MVDLRNAEIGSKWKTRKGRMAVLVRKDLSSEWPATFEGHGTEYTTMWDGRFWGPGTNENEDIVAPWNEPAKITVEPAAKTNVLQEAQAVAGNGAERARDYGHPYENHERIARLWNAYDLNKKTPGSPDTPKDVALKMVLLKIAREQNTHKRDNLVDIAGYILCAEQIVERGNA